MKRIAIVTIALLGWVFTGTAQDRTANTEDTAKESAAKKEAAVQKDAASIQKDAATNTKEEKAEVITADDQVKSIRKKEDATLREDDKE